MVTDVASLLSLTGLVWAFALGSTSLILFIAVFTVVSLIDLESDFVNPLDMCERVNKTVIPEYTIHALLMVIFLCTGFWIEAFINLPLLVFHIHRVYHKKHKLDPTQIFRTLTHEKRIGLLRVVYHLVCLFFYLFVAVAAFTRMMLNKSYYGALSTANT